jgi:hypothetical protein
MIVANDQKNASDAPLIGVVTPASPEATATTIERVKRRRNSGKRGIDRAAGSASPRGALNQLRGSHKRSLLVHLMDNTMGEYVSPRTEDKGLEAFLADVAHASPLRFLQERVKLEPKQTSITSDSRHLTVIMHTDSP